MSAYISEYTHMYAYLVSGVTNLKRENNCLGDAIETLKSVWMHRKGVTICGKEVNQVKLFGKIIHIDNTTPAAIIDTFNVLYGDKPKPLLSHKHRTASGWHLVFSIPPGVAFNRVKEQREYFEDASNSSIIMTKKGGHLHMDIHTAELQEKYPYRWNAEQYKDMALPIPIGWSSAGFQAVDLADMPHMLVAGHPGAGKSNFLHGVAVSLLTSCPAWVVIIDFKVLEFSYLKEHALVITDTENARILLTALNKEMDKRLNTLQSAGCVKIQEYKGEMPYICLIIDELAEMQDEECQNLLNRVLRLARAAGISVVCATQRPSSTTFKKFGDSKAMFSASMCFRVRDEVNSRMVLDSDQAARLPEIPGRGVFQWGEQMEVQGMYLPVSQARKLIAQAEITSRKVDIDAVKRQTTRLLPR